MWPNFLASRLVDRIEVLSNNHGLDHQAIDIGLTLGKLVAPMRNSRPKWEVVSPDLVQEKLRPLVESLISAPPTDIDNQVIQLTTGVASVQANLCRKVRVNQQKAKSWWCKATLDPIIETRNRARRWFILTRSLEAAECYRQWSTYFLDSVKSLKQQAWWRFLYNPSEDSVFKALRFAKQTRSRGILPLRRPDGKITSDKMEQAGLLFHGKSCISAPVDLTDIPPSSRTRIVCYPMAKVVEVCNWIKKMAPKKAPGIDGITNEMLKISAPSLAPVLTFIFNLALASSYFPKAWRCAVTAIIPKAAKDDYTDSNAYRPIALLSGMGKILELLIAHRLMEWAENAGILASGHLGGRKGAGTEDALVLLDTWVWRKWHEGKLVTGLFLDVKSASFCAPQTLDTLSFPPPMSDLFDRDYCLFPARFPNHDSDGRLHVGAF